MTKISLPNVPFVEAFHHGGKHRPTTIVIRNSESSSHSGAALAIADFWHRPSSPLKSSHYVVDAGNTYRCVPDRLISGQGSFALKRSITILVCAELFESENDWYTPERAMTLTRAAALIGQLSLFYKIPVQYLDDMAPDSSNIPKLRFNGGIIIDASGFWPKSEFINEIRSQKALIRSIK